MIVQLWLLLLLEFIIYTSETSLSAASLLLKVLHFT